MGRRADYSRPLHAVISLHHRNLMLLVATVAAASALASTACAAGVPVVAAAHSRTCSTPQTCAEGRAAEGPSVSVVLTNRSLSSALSVRPSVRFGVGSTANLPVIRVMPRVRYQAMTQGFGAAMTDTSAWLLWTQLSTRERGDAFERLFGSQGIHIDYVRIPIGASDFTATGVPYSYDDMPAGQSDPTLVHFSVGHDEAYIIPALQTMLAINPHIWTLASPWSPPPWLKDNDSFNNLNLDGGVPRANFPVLARYFVKFIEAYEAQGIHIDAITPMNEPESPSTYPGSSLLPAAQEAFIPQDLVPALHAADLNVGVWGSDDANIPDARTILQSKMAYDLAGLAFHCYGGMDGYTQLHQKFPKAPLIESECSPGITPYSVAETVIDAARNWAQGVQLWNLALDPSHGPVELPDTGCPGCTGIITIDQQNRTANYGLNYYELGQISKFVMPGAVRVYSDRMVHDWNKGFAANEHGVTAGVDNVAFQNPDGAYIMVAFNSATTPKTFAVSYEGRAFPYKLGASSTVTFIWR